MANNDSPEQWLTYGLMQVMKAYRRVTEARLNELGLHTGQELVLFKLWCDGSATPTQLAEHLDVEPPTVSKMLSRMEAAGLVERCADSEDARVARIHLTERGRALEAPVREAWAEVDGLTSAGLSEVEKALLRRMLAQIHTNLGAAGCIVDEE